MDDLTSPVSDPGSDPLAAALDALRADHEALRARVDGLAEAVTSRQLSAVDAEGRERVRLDGDAATVTLLDPDGFARIRLTTAGDQGRITVASRTTDGEPTRIDVFALDAEADDDGDQPYVGIELIRGGDTVAGLSQHGTRPPRLWTHDPGT